jgi:anaerobic magnesium-protoporphyrin IX monomethyl ester cyclase
LKDKKNKIILYNPRSGTYNRRLPISILQIGASIAGKHDFVFVDANMERDPWQKLNRYLETGEFSFFACTVMPGPQLTQSILFTKAIKEKFPGITTIWGGYFPSNHYRVCIESGIIDYIIRGPGDCSFPKLIHYLQEGRRDQLAEIGNLVFRMPGGNIVLNPIDPVPEQDTLPELPYEVFDQFYPVEKYIVKTFMGERTFSYHSSIGCPYSCGFCGVSSIYDSSWKGKSAKKMAGEILALKDRYRIDSIEFHDNNFFSSHSRTIEFCRLMKGQGITWWADGRIDTMNHYSDEELRLLRESGCCLVFMGAETENEEILSQINKGAAIKANETFEIVRRFSKFDIIPELSFVFGFPDSSPERIDRQILNDIHFIRSLKKLNPKTEVILYIYSPVPYEGSALFKTVRGYGPVFPSALYEWLKPEWEYFYQRRGVKMPWLRPPMIRFIRDFQFVMMAAYPSISNFQISKSGKMLLKIPGRIRYKLRLYRFPFEVRVLLKLLSYRSPEKEGFYSE